MGLPLPTPAWGETSPLWGVELVMDVERCHGPAICDGDTIRRYVEELVENIGMEAFGEPLLARFALDNPDAAGFSVVQPADRVHLILQLITTSLVSGHFSELRGTAYINVFSCAEYAVADVMEFTAKFFSGSDEEATISEHWVLRRGTHERPAVPA